MSFYDTLTKSSYATTIVSTTQPMDDDVKQAALLKSFHSYLNKYGTADGFEEFCRTAGGDHYLRKITKFAFIDLFNSKHLKARNRKKDSELINNVELEPVSMSSSSTLKMIEGMSSGEETNIARAQKQMEVQDQLRSMYQSADTLKKQAMDLMVEAMDFKDNGQPVPDRIRTALSRLRVEIQKTDPRWKLDLHLL